MAVNLSKHRLDLLTAYQDVIDEGSSTDWALYTYEDDSNDLTLALSGDGGLPEITETFDSASIMYGFCSLKEPSAALPHYILINWVGDDVPDARKCVCASHVATIAEFFQGVDVIVNASSVDDIDASAIEQRLTNGVAVVTSPVLSRLRMRDEEKAETVGTRYQKTNAEVEIKRVNREEFWEKAKREEEIRKEEERRKAAEERQRFELERMEQERREQEERERRYQERERQIEELRRKQQMQENGEASVRATAAVSVASRVDKLQRMESEVQEAAALIAQRRENPREFFKQREKAAGSFDCSSFSVHRTGRMGNPFLKLQHSLPEHSLPPLLSPTLPYIRLQPDANDTEKEETLEHRADKIQPPIIPRIVTTTIEEEEADDADLEDSGSDDLIEEFDDTSPPQSGSARAREAFMSTVLPDEDLISDIRAPQQETGRPLSLWDTEEPSEEPLADVLEESSLSQALPVEQHPDVPHLADDSEPSSLVDISGPHQMTLSYQQALQQAAGSDSQDLEDAQLLMTNGESLLKEGAQASEGYFSQSQEEEFAQSEECSAKEVPRPVFYNKPPEIDITCWDADPVTEDDEYGAAE